MASLGNIFQYVLLGEEIAADFVEAESTISTGAPTDLPPFDIVVDGNKFSININLTPQSAAPAGTVTAPSSLAKWMQELELAVQLVPELIAVDVELSTDQQATFPLFDLTLSDTKFVVTIVATPVTVAAEVEPEVEPVEEVAEVAEVEPIVTPSEGGAA